MGPAPTHSPHRVKALFHSTAMVRDYDQTVSRLGELFGLRVLEYSEAHEPAVGRRGGMTWVGDGSIEICEPIVEGAPPDRFVKRTGGGMQGLGLWVDDFAATTRHLETAGIAMPVQLGRFGFSRPRDTAGLQFEWSEFTVEEDPRAGAPEPAFLSSPVVRVSHQAFVGAVVDDPLSAARTLASAFSVPVTFEEPAAGPGRPHAGISLGDCTLAFYPLLPEGSLELWGRRHDRPRVSLVGLAVDDLERARRDLTGAGVRILREEPGSLVLDPDTTATVEVVVVDALLAGDPRSPSG